MDLGTMLSLAEPARHARIDGPDSPAAARLYAQITAAPVPVPARRRRRFALVAALGAGLAAAGTAGVLAVAPGGPAAATAVLDQTALTAARQPAAAGPGPGQYIYAETIEGQWNTGTGTRPISPGICVQTVRIWASPDGSGHGTASEPAGECSDGAIPPELNFRKGQQVDSTVYPRAADLPTSLPALKRFIEQHFINGKRDDASTFAFAGTFLQAGAPPAVRAALYRLIGSLPGIESLGPMTDRLGRHGMGVGLTTYGVRDVLIFDPATTAVLQEEGIAVDPGQIPVPPGGRRLRPNQVIRYTVYQASAIVNAVGALPPAAARTSQ
jgi:hypothetical protein